MKRLTPAETLEVIGMAAERLHAGPAENCEQHGFDYKSMRSYVMRLAALQTDPLYALLDSIGVPVKPEQWLDENTIVTASAIMFGFSMGFEARKIVEDPSYGLDAVNKAEVDPGKPHHFRERAPQSNTCQCGRPQHWHMHYGSTLAADRKSAQDDARGEADR